MPPVRTMVILGPWSCGSTAVAGYLRRLGAHTAPPHRTTNDPSTPDSHEPHALREALAARVDPTVPCRRDDDQGPFVDWFEQWLDSEHERAEDRGATHLVLKQPLLAFFLDELWAVCTPELVVVNRSLGAIEASRRRRGWHAVHGRTGAERIYEHVDAFCKARHAAAVACYYERFRRDQRYRKDLCARLGLRPSSAALAGAESWIR